MLSRKNGAALSLLVSSMFSAAFLATAPRGFIAAAAGPEALPAAFQQALATVRGGAAGVRPAPAAFVAAQTSDHQVLTPAQMSKLEAYTQKFGVDAPLDPIITSFFGLTPPGVTMTFRQLNGNDHGDNIHLHYFNRSESDPNILIFYFQNTEENLVWGYLTDPQFNYLAGYVTNGIPTTLPRQDGAAGLASELRWWAKELALHPDL